MQELRVMAASRYTLSPIAVACITEVTSNSPQFFDTSLADQFIVTGATTRTQGDK